LRWKPGDPNRRPPFVAPYMPRLDWQMWFAALDPPASEYWLASLAQRIVDMEPSVMRLLGPTPLAGRPRAVRLAYYSYRFATRAEHAQDGAWWSRTFQAYLN
jgi:lipase maturation factor 1